MINAVKHIAKREIRRIFSNRIYLICMLGAPVFCTVFFISLMWKGLPEDLPIALVDMDNSQNSRNLGRQLDAFNQTKIVMRTLSFSEAREEMQKGNIYGIMLIPENFGVLAASGKQPRLSFYTNNSYLIAGSLLFKDMKTISTLASGAVSREMGRARGYTDRQIMSQLQPIVIDAHPLGNPALNYSIYLNNIFLMGILQLMIFLVTVYSIGVEIKEKTAREWLEMGNNSLTISLAGKLLPQTFIFLCVGMSIASLLFAFLDFPLETGLFPMLLAMLLFILSAQAIGIMMIGVLPTLRLGLSFASLFGMLSFSMAGLSFPVTAMYPPIQALTCLFPLRHYYSIYVDQALNGRAFVYSLTQYLSLLLFLFLPFLVLKNLKRALLYFEYKA